MEIDVFCCTSGLTINDIFDGRVQEEVAMSPYSATDPCDVGLSNTNRVVTWTVAECCSKRRPRIHSPGLETTIGH